MDTNDLIPSLALITLVLALVIAVGGYLMFKRKPANRHPMEQRPDGAIAEVRPTDAPR